jgi:ADP-heptose:LPS heptosyltransferase
MFPTAEDDRFVEDFLKSQWLAENQKLVGIHITASPRWQTKVWPAGNIVRLCEELGKRDIRVVITGTDKDRVLVTSLAAGVKNLKLINSCGKLTINQLACLIKRCAVYITGDSAPLHIAAGVDTPVIALFGPTDPKRHMPPARVCSVIRKKLPCSPCYKPKCAHGKCMSSITAEEVMAEVDKLLK